MKSRILAGAVLAIFAILLQTVALAEGNPAADKTIQQVVEPRYHSVLNEWKRKGLDGTNDFVGTVPPSHFNTTADGKLLSQSESKGYGDRVFHWQPQESFSLEVEVPADGLYELGLDYYPLGDGIVPIEAAVRINDSYPYYESRRIVFPVQWKNETDRLERDRFGNEMIPKQVPVPEWSRIKAEDASHLQASPLKYYLKKGTNRITFTNVRGELLVGNVYVTSPAMLPSYQEYLTQHPAQKATDALQVYEAEKTWKKNSSFIRPVANQDPGVIPYDTKHLLLNTFGGDSWSWSGQSASWKIEVEQDGYYHLTLKVLQEKETGGPVFRTLLIDSSVPFAEVAHYPFEYSKKWSNITLGDANGTPYLFYLSKGSHVITLVADASPAEPVLAAINQVMQEIEDLSLSIKKLIGNQKDRSRGWNISEYIPDMDRQLKKWADALEKEANYLQGLSKSKRESQEVVSLQLAVRKLRTLAISPDEIPNRLTELSEGSSSVAQLLGTLGLDLQKQPLLIDRFYVHGDLPLPSAESGFYRQTVEAIKRFFLSFTSGTYTASETDDDTVEVWVNRPRQYVELMQNMADRMFTAETGIRVKFSIMPDEQKLILANAANKQPDAALGISNWLPYELAIRGAAVDLHKFPDFENYIRKFSPGAFLPMIIDDSVYALPETQDFFVLFYRKDILETLGIPVPDTWTDVAAILPELQRYGMNFYSPIAGAVGFKPFQTTAPFIYQFQGNLYSKDGMRTAIDSEAALKGIRFMTELNTIYSLPLQVPNFYNHFRYGTLPIGISNFTTYVQLTSAAPEIAGWWDISLHPGVRQQDGTVARWATGSGQSAMIFKGSKKQKEAWQLLKWWMSTETQTEFAANLQTMFGPEYMWNTSNLEAFAKLPWPEEHKRTIMKQWEYLMEVPKTPGAYMIERELSNIWNRIVFSGETTRSAVDDSVIAINREIGRKMEEFGYLKGGKAVKEYRVPSIDLVKSWAGKKHDE